MITKIVLKTLQMNDDNWQPANNAPPITHAFKIQREILVDTNDFP